MAEVYIETAKAVGNTTVVTGYIEGIVRLGIVFTVIRQCLEMRGGKRVQLPTLANPRPAQLRVIRILSYEEDLTEIVGRAGCIHLEGIGGDLIHWGDVISE